VFKEFPHEIPLAFTWQPKRTHPNPQSPSFVASENSLTKNSERQAWKLPYLVILGWILIGPSLLTARLRRRLQCRARPGSSLIMGYDRFSNFTAQSTRSPNAYESTHIGKRTRLNEARCLMWNVWHKVGSAQVASFWEQYEKFHCRRHITVREDN